MKAGKFIRLASICSFLGAITTILLIYLPDPSAAGFEAEVALHSNTLYMAKLWILFTHPQFNVIAALGIGILLFKKYPEYIIPGVLALMVWGFAEMAQQAFMINAVNLIWRPAYLQTVDTTAITTLKTHLSGSEAISSSMFLLVEYGFGLGTLLLGMVLVKERGLAFWIGLVNILIGAFMLTAFTVDYFGFSLFSVPVKFFFKNAYPILQPAVRITLGIWLWNKFGTE